MIENATPLERLNAIEKSLSILLCERKGLTQEEVLPKRLTNLPVWKGGEHLLLRCYKRSPIVLSEYLVPVDLQRDDQGQVEITLSNQKGLFSIITLDCGNAVILLDCKLAKERELKTSYFGHLFDLQGCKRDDMDPSAIVSFPYLSPIEFGQRWILKSRGTLNIGVSIQSKNRIQENRLKRDQAIIQELVLEQRKSSQELNALKADISELNRQLKELSYIIKALDC